MRNLTSMTALAVVLVLSGCASVERATFADNTVVDGYYTPYRSAPPDPAPGAGGLGGLGGGASPR